MAAFCASPHRYAQFVAYSAADAAVGFVEAAARIDHVNGTRSTPVAFLEGMYVVPEARRQGVARALVAVVESGGHAHASRALHRTQSTVTYTINKLEDQLGVPLFERQGRRSVLTPAGLGRLRAAAPVHLEGIQVHFLDKFDPDELRTLGALLGRLIPGTTP